MGLLYPNRRQPTEGNEFMQRKSPERLTRELKLRVSEPVRRAIEKAAKFNGVSLNTEIHNRLERSISPMAEEVLRLTFPSDWEPIVAAYRLGRLRLTPDDLKRLEAVLVKWARNFNTALEG